MSLLLFSILVIFLILTLLQNKCNSYLHCTTYRTDFICYHIPVLSYFNKCTQFSHAFIFKLQHKVGGREIYCPRCFQSCPPPHIFRTTDSTPRAVADFQALSQHRNLHDLCSVSLSPVISAPKCIERHGFFLYTLLRKILEVAIQ